MGVRSEAWRVLHQSLAETSATCPKCKSDLQQRRETYFVLVYLGDELADFRETKAATEKT
jgi:hypothetical protein